MWLFGHTAHTQTILLHSYRILDYSLIKFHNSDKHADEQWNNNKLYDWNIQFSVLRIKKLSKDSTVQVSTYTYCIPQEPEVIQYQEIVQWKYHIVKFVFFLIPMNIRNSVCVVPKFLSFAVRFINTKVVSQFGFNCSIYLLFYTYIYQNDMASIKKRITFPGARIHLFILSVAASEAYVCCIFDILITPFEQNNMPKLSKSV